MIGEAHYHKDVPKDYEGNLEFRLHVLGKAIGNVPLQRSLVEMCKRDVLFYINTFVWQYNPDKVQGEIGPFITWEFQDRALLDTMHRLFEERKDALWEKSREMGATWMAVIIDDWMARFHNWKKFLVISHSADAVDRAADSDTLFWKVNFINDHLPHWLRSGMKKRKMGLDYQATKSSINGAASTERSGVGGRATAVMLDEFSKQRDDRKILGQTRDTGPRLFIGTHYGLDSAFYELTRRADMFKIMMHWSQHPEKGKGAYRYNAATNQIEIIDKSYAFPADYQFVMDQRPTGGPFPGVRSPWYDEECRERANLRDVAMHLDIDPSGSVAEFFDPLMLMSLSDMCLPAYWVGDIRYDEDTGALHEIRGREGGFLRLWVKPDAEGKVPPAPYAIGADVSGGTGRTPSCLSVGNCQTGEQVGEYVNANIKPDDLAPLAVALCQLFADKDKRPAKLGWEVPGPGAAMGKRVIEELGFRNYYSRKNQDLVFQKAKYDCPGWANSNKTTMALLNAFQAALSKRQCLIRSEELLKECRYFQYNPAGWIEHAEIDSQDDPSGATINHGDRVIAGGIMWMLIAELGLMHRVQARKDTGPQMLSLAWRRDYHDNAAKRAESWIS